MPFSPKSSQRIIAAPDRIKQGQLLSRTIDSDKKVSQFNLFENFMFSTSESPEGEAAACSPNYSKMANNQMQKNGQLKNNWEEDVLPRFANMNLQHSSSSMDPKAPDFVQCGKCVAPINKSQQFVLTDRKFCPANPNGYQYVYGNYPGYYMVQSQGSFYEPWPVRSVPQFANNGAIPTQFYINHWDEHPNYYPTVSYKTDMCNANYMNPNFQYQENPFAIEFPKKDVAQGEEEISKSKIKNKAKAALLTSKPVKPIKKIGFPKFPRRKNYTHEIQDENIICSSTAPTPIPKGARPILSAKK